MKTAFLTLVRLGIGEVNYSMIPTSLNWRSIQHLAEKQGLAAIVLDGLERLPEPLRPKKEQLLEWIGLILQDEAAYSNQRRAAEKMASLFHDNNIRTYVLKGFVVSECYPQPSHRVSVDFDCFLLPYAGNYDAWSLGNDLIKSEGIDIDFEHYKNSAFIYSGIPVENHHFLTPFRGNNQMARFEKHLQSLLKVDRGEDRIEGTWLFRPPVMVTALFLIEHAYSHFLHEGLTWRHVLDWMMFSRKHKKEIDWKALDAMIDDYGFKKFYNAFYKMGMYLLGAVDEGRLNKHEQMMLADIWSDLDLHDTVRGLKGKTNLAGNTWRARWKYRYFSDISMLRALWIQVKGYLFIRQPKLN